MKKYAVRVQFDDGWLYISEGPIDELRPMLMSPEQAEEMVKLWVLEGNEEAVEIVEYND